MRLMALFLGALATQAMLACDRPIAGPVSPAAPTFHPELSSATGAQLATALDIRRYLTPAYLADKPSCQIHRKGAASFRHVGAPLPDGSWFDVWVHISYRHEPMLYEVTRGWPDGHVLDVSILFSRNRLWTMRDKTLTDQLATGPLADIVRSVGVAAASLPCG